MDYSLELLKNLSKKFTLILLGKGDEKRKNLINNLDIKQYFQDMLLVDEKNINQLELIKNKFPKNTIFYSIGDRIKKEIYLGNKMKFKTIWFRNGKFSSETPENNNEKPWKTVDSLKDIELYLK